MFFHADPHIVFDSTNPNLDPAEVTPEKVNQWFVEQSKTGAGVHNKVLAAQDELTIVDGVVTSYVGTQSHVEIPAYRDGQPVHTIGAHAFERAYALTQITLPETITTIEPWAFCFCKNLTSVELPESLTTIGEHAFQYCHALTSIHIPAATTQIASLAFTMCDGLTAITVDPANAAYADNDGVLFTKDQETLLRYPTGRKAETYAIPEGTKVIADEAFKSDYRTYRNLALQEVTFPESLTEIESNAFTQTSLKKLSIPAGVTLQKYAFSLNQQLEYVELEEGITELGEGVLAGLDSFTGTLVLPTSLKKIGYRTFDRVNAHKVVLPESLEYIAEEAFVAARANAWHIPASVTNINERAFYLAGMDSVTFAEGSEITSIQPYTFAHCRELSEVTLPQTLTNLADGAFSICTGLKNIELPKYLRTLEDAVFAGSGLVGIDLNTTELVAIGDSTFMECAFLSEAVLPRTLQKLGNGTFENCQSLRTVVVPEGCKLSEIPADTFKGCEFLPVLRFDGAKSSKMVAKYSA